MTDLRVSDSRHVPETNGTTPAVAVPRRRSGLLDKLIPLEPDAVPMARPLVSLFAMTFVVLNVVAAFQMWFTLPVAIRANVSLTLAATACVYGSLLILIRRGAYRPAVVILIATQIAIPTFIAILDHQQTAGEAFSTAAWLCVASLTMSIFGTTLATALVGLLSAACVLAAYGPISGISLANKLHPLIFVLTMTTVAVLSLRHHARVEATRQFALASHNADLEALGSSLEQRVRERTRQLEESHDALSKAYENLRSNQRALVVAEKMAAVGRLTAGFAHEMSSPLAAVLASLDSLGDLVDEYDRSIGDASVEPEDHRAIAREMKDVVDVARQATERSATFLRSMRAQTRAAGPRRSECFEASPVVKGALDLLSYAARTARCALHVELVAQPVELMGDPSRLQQAVTNLAQNAIDATADRGGGDVRVRVVPIDGRVRIEVRDEGGGVPDEIRGRIFEPLFTTKPFGRGTGLGLSIVKEVVEDDFGGAVGVESVPGRGSTFWLEIPLRKEPADAA